MDKRFGHRPAVILRPRVRKMKLLFIIRILFKIHLL